jgi:iron complex transport system substrate-binding protein
MLLAVALAGAAGAPPQRIVSTSPSITEILFALGLGPRVVAVTNFCHYPPEVNKLPKVGTYLRPNLETIASLRPDLVVIEDNPIQLAGKLAALGLKPLEIEPKDLAGIRLAITRVGDAAGVPQAAAQLNARMQADLEAIRKEAAKRRRTRVAFIVGRTPGSLEGLVAVGRASFLNELIELAGGENVFRESASPYPKVPLEEILGRNPDVIVDMGDMADTAKITEQHRREVPRLWQRYPALKAVRDGRVFAVASDIFVVPGPRVVEAAREFARMFATAQGGAAR